MALNFLNMILDPVYAAFSNFNPDNNLFQSAFIICVILGVISGLTHLINK